VDSPQDKHIVKTPGVCGGRARIAGHRVRVMDIVGWHERRERSVAQIVEMFPGISRADVHAALAYYYDHPEERRFKRTKSGPNGPRSTLSRSFHET
jgi:uncharacterized protein (DUF433 family)